MADYLNKLFWGVFFITFHINIGPLTILPNFVGFMLISSAIKDVYNQYGYESFKKSCSFARIAIIISFLWELAIAFSPVKLEDSLIIQIWTIALMLIEVFVFYNFFQAISEYFYLKEDISMAEKYIVNTRIYILISIVSIIVLSFSTIFNFNLLSLIFYILSMIIRISIMIMISGLKKIFIDKEKDVNN